MLAIAALATCAYSQRSRSFVQSALWRLGSPVSPKEKNAEPRAPRSASATHTLLIRWTTVQYATSIPARPAAATKTSQKGRVSRAVKNSSATVALQSRTRSEGPTLRRRPLFSLMANVPTHQKNSPTPAACCPSGVPAGRHFVAGGEVRRGGRNPRIVSTITFCRSPSGRHSSWRTTIVFALRRTRASTCRTCAQPRCSLVQLASCVRRMALNWNTIRMTSIQFRASIITVLIFVSASTRSVADTFGSGANNFEIQFVTIDHPGNDTDTHTGTLLGSVPNVFRIGRFEISEQMIEAANQLGGLGITMDTRGSNKPATSISWFEAAKFVNWLNTSTGSPPAYNFNGTGFMLWPPGSAGYDSANLYRNSLARYFLPSADEWHKAAYYDASQTAYFIYPTGSDAVPTPTSSGSAPNTAVFDQPLAQGPAEIAQAGGLSPFGTMGQGGNVWEWEETDFDRFNNAINSPRGLRGGFWGAGSPPLLSSFRTATEPSVEGSLAGFRVASIPEPGSLILLSTICLSMLALRPSTRKARVCR
jgi:sulfatase modifying factor 1